MKTKDWANKARRKDGTNDIYTGPKPDGDSMVELLNDMHEKVSMVVVQGETKELTLVPKRGGRWHIDELRQQHTAENMPVLLDFTATLKVVTTRGYLKVPRQRR